MTPFAYLSVLISIVLGLGLTELLSGVQRLVHQRDRIRFFCNSNFYFFDNQLLSYLLMIKNKPTNTGNENIN